jgi:hypothetical protein
MMPYNVEIYRCILSTIELYCHVYERLYTGFGLVIVFIEHLQIVTTSNSSTISNSHPLQFTTGSTKFS